MGMFSEIESARCARLLEAPLLASLEPDTNQDIYYYCLGHIYPVYRRLCGDGYIDQNEVIRENYDINKESRVSHYEKPKSEFYKEAIERQKEEL